MLIDPTLSVTRIVNVEVLKVEVVFPDNTPVEVEYVNGLGGGGVIL